MGLLSERIIWARRSHARISQAALAKACGVSRNAVSLWESGETKSLDAAYLFNIAGCGLSFQRRQDTRREPQMAGDRQRQQIPDGDADAAFR